MSFSNGNRTTAARVNAEGGAESAATDVVIEMTSLLEAVPRMRMFPGRSFYTEECCHLVVQVADFGKDPCGYPESVSED